MEKKKKCWPLFWIKFKHLTYEQLQFLTIWTTNLVIFTLKCHRYTSCCYGMVNSTKSEKNLSEWYAKMVKTPLSTSSLPTLNDQQLISISPNAATGNGIAIDEPTTMNFTSNHQMMKRIGGEELTLLMPSSPSKSLIPTTTYCAHLTPNSGISLSSMGRPLCRICHLVHETCRNPLVAPCRCSGTMQYVHIGCLVHWLEVSARKMYPQPRCELCGYNYKRHPCIDLKRLHVPHVDRKDVALNVVFLFSIFVMILCAAVGIHFLRISDQYRTSLRAYRITPTVMNNDDLTVIACSVLFFIAFFISVFTQYRAGTSIFRVIFRFWLTNRNWQICNYDISYDPEMLVEKLARNEKVDIASASTTNTNTDTDTERCLMLI